MLLFRCSVTEQTKCIYIYVHSHPMALQILCHLLLFVKQKIAGVSEVQPLTLLRGMRRSELVMPLQGVWLQSSGFLSKMGYDSACLKVFFNILSLFQYFISKFLVQYSSRESLKFLSIKQMRCNGFKLKYQHMFRCGRYLKPGTPENPLPLP